MAAEQIAILERTLGEAGVRYRTEVYGGAQHGYAMADHVAYDEAARERHFGELRALLKRTSDSARAGASRSQEDRCPGRAY